MARLLLLPLTHYQCIHQVFLTDFSPRCIPTDFTRTLCQCAQGILVMKAQKGLRHPRPAQTKPRPSPFPTTRANRTRDELKCTIKIWSGHFEITNNGLPCTNSLKFNIRRGYQYFKSFQKILLNVLYNEMRLKKGSEGIL